MVRSHLLETVRLTLVKHYMENYMKDRNGVAPLTEKELADKSGVSIGTIKKAASEGQMTFAVPCEVSRSEPFKKKYTVTKTMKGWQISQPALAAHFAQFNDGSMW